MKNMSEIEIELQDTEWEASYIDHDRLIARAVVFDDEGYYYFVRAERDDDFGKAVLIETSGGGVESGEELEIAVKRELGEELGADVELARLGALLHDLGKSMDHNTEGTHAKIGAEFAKRYGVNAKAVNIIASHHHEVEQESVEAVIVEAADAISGALSAITRS